MQSELAIELIRFDWYKLWDLANVAYKGSVATRTRDKEIGSS